ncbi:hypothetical protein ACFY93_10530 [Streptomyces sp. NPDC008313]|uniref:hypothetical protein n=1 Tax=Streptomyces sp. NPDC008313 TaxID=3364826 RepID=UPI0036EB069A
MDETSPREARSAASTSAGRDAAGQAGVIGIGLAAVLTFALTQGSWQWFATYIGVTLLAVIFSFYRLPPWTPGLRTAYMANLTAYSLVVGLCTAIALAPMLQRWAWLFPMPGARDRCPALGAYESIRTEAALAGLAGRDRAALVRAQDVQSHDAVADCLSSTTTLWLPVYAAGAAVLVALGAWSIDRARSGNEPAEDSHDGTQASWTAPSASASASEPSNRWAASSSWRRSPAMASGLVPAVPMVPAASPPYLSRARVVGPVVSSTDFGGSFKVF